MFAQTGNYTEHTNDDFQNSVYYTFTPRPLMDGGFYDMDDDLAALLADAHRVLGVISGMMPFIDDKDALADLVLFKESIY